MPFDCHLFPVFRAALCNHALSDSDVFRTNDARRKSDARARREDKKGDGIQFGTKSNDTTKKERDRASSFED